MKIEIIKTTTTIMNEERVIESSSSSETFRIIPEKNKILKNIKTGQITRAHVCVNKKSKVADYVELDDPALLKYEESGSNQLV